MPGSPPRPAADGAGGQVVDVEQAGEALGQGVAESALVGDQRDPSDPVQAHRIDDSSEATGLGERVDRRTPLAGGLPAQVAVEGVGALEDAHLLGEDGETAAVHDEGPTVDGERGQEVPAAPMSTPKGTLR